MALNKEWNLPAFSIEFPRENMNCALWKSQARRLSALKNRGKALQVIISMFLLPSAVTALKQCPNVLAVENSNDKEIGGEDIVDTHLFQASLLKQASKGWKD